MTSLLLYEETIQLSTDSDIMLQSVSKRSDPRHNGPLVCRLDSLETQRSTIEHKRAQTEAALALLDQVARIHQRGYRY